MKKLIYTFYICCISFVGHAQQTPAINQSKSILIKEVTIHIGNGEVIENGFVGFENGKIIEVGTKTTEKIYEETIQANGKHLYPGFIAVNSTLGMVEIDAIRPTNDLNEIGDFLPHIRTIIAYNAESKVVESVRPNGILTAQITPRRGRIAGTSSIVQLDAWNWEDAALKSDSGLHIFWPRTYRRGRTSRGEDPLVYDQKNYEEEVKDLNRFMREAGIYQQKTNPKQLAYEALKNALSGNQKVYLHAKEKRQIIDGIIALKKHGIEDIILVGGDDAHLIIPFLNENKIPVVVSRPHRLPNTDDEDVKLPFRMAKKLIDGGLLVTIDLSGRMERMNTRNLPFYAGSFAAYGVPKEKAVQMITLDAARIIGVDDQLGSIEIGKDATFFIAEGDALDMRTNLLSHAYIQGRAINLETHQTKLWKRYMEKYSRK